MSHWVMRGGDGEVSEVSMESRSVQASLRAGTMVQRGRHTGRDFIRGWPSVLSKEPNKPALSSIKANILPTPTHTETRVLPG